MHSWSWIWKLQLPGKYKFFFWLACHDVVPTLAPSVICSRCDLHNETFLHCVCGCIFFVMLWHHLGFTNSEFFSSVDTYEWLGGEGARGYQAITFSVGVWWSWQHQNLICLGGETWSLQRLTCNIKNLIESIELSFPLLFLLLRLTGTSDGIIIIFRVLFLMWIVVVTALLLEPGLVESCVMTRVYSLWVSLISFQDHLTSCWLSFLLSITIWSWWRI